MMQKQFLIRRIATQVIEYAIRVSVADPDFIGPVTDENPAPAVAPIVEPGCEAIEWPGDSLLDKSPTSTAVLRWNGSAPAWIEEGALQQLIASAVARCYVDIDAIYAAAIGNRQAEYTDAEADARAFVADGHATENVTSFARCNPTGAAQTNAWAAAQIIARADAFRTAQLAMRTQRFDSQAAMRACATPAELAHVVYLWDQFIAGLRAQLGL